MTIAVGILCSDGIVLGVDLQYSTGWVKTAGKKIFILKPSYEPNAYCSAVLAAAGNPDSAKKIVEKIEETLPSNLDLSTFKDCVEAALASVYFQHIDSAPLEERDALHCDFVIGVRFGQDCKLFRTNRTMVVEETDYACLGMGLYLGHYTLGLLLPRSCSVEVAAQVATYVIDAAKEYVESVGKGTDIHILRTDGLHYGFLKRERMEIEEAFDGFFECLRNVVSCIDTSSVAEESVPLYLDIFGAAVRKLRGAQAVRDKLRANRRAKRSAKKSDPPSPTADPSPPRPSPESSGGPDES